MSSVDSPSLSSGAVADQLGAELIGSADIVLSGLEGLEKAQSHDLSFVRDTKHIDALHETKAGAVIISRPVVETLGKTNGSLPPLIVVEDADRAMAMLLAAITPPLSKPDSGVHPTAIVHESASIGQGVAIAAHVTVGPGCTIGNGVVLGAGVRIGAEVSIGDGSELRSNVVIEDRCVIGRQTVIHAGVVIGCDGFGYIPSPDGQGLMKVPHAGHVEIGDGVEIGANTTIDRGKFGATSIGDGTKIDNLVQIGHNCVIGRACVICGCCGISGSVTIGDGVMMGGGVGVADGISIGSKAVIGGFSGVKDHVPAGETWIGYPARPGRHAMRIISATDALPDLMRTVRKAERDGDRA